MLKETTQFRSMGDGQKFSLPVRESNPGLPRDRRGYSPLYYRGCLLSLEKLFSMSKDLTKFLPLCKNKPRPAFANSQSGWIDFASV